MLLLQSAIINICVFNVSDLHNSINADNINMYINYISLQINREEDRRRERERDVCVYVHARYKLILPINQYGNSMAILIRVTVKHCLLFMGLFKYTSNFIGTTKLQLYKDKIKLKCMFYLFYISFNFTHVFSATVRMHMCTCASMQTWKYSPCY